jgi:hypothetical protein
LDLDYAQFSKVTPMPATEMYTLLPKYMARAASRLKSYDELKRSAETAIKMLTEPVDRDDAGMEVLA